MCLVFEYRVVKQSQGGGPEERKKEEKEDGEKKEDWKGEEGLRRLKQVHTNGSIV